MEKLAQPAIRITTPHREFTDHEDSIIGVTFFPDGRRMVSGSLDGTVFLWDLKDGVVLKKMEGHSSPVLAVAVSRDGQLIASGDANGQLIAWHGDTGESLTQTIKFHSKGIFSLDFSPDGTLLATGSYDRTTELWSTETWQVQGNPISCGPDVRCVRFSPSGEPPAIATKTHSDIQIWNPRTGECIAKLRGATNGNASVAWTPDGKRLLSGGTRLNPHIWEWDTSTWQSVGDPWSGHSGQIAALTVNSAGTLVASASHDSHVRLWCLSERRSIAIFKASDAMYSVAFSIDGKYILCVGEKKNITEWAVPDSALMEDTPRERASDEHSLQGAPEEQATNEARRDSHAKVLSINTAVRDACLIGDLRMAETLLTQQIKADGNNYNSYANRSFVMARQREWDHALEDAVRSISIQPSLSGYISKGIALCGKMHFGEMVEAFDIAFMFTDGDSNKIDLVHTLVDHMT